MIILRYTFFALSSLGLIFYGLFFIRIPKNLRTFEHKYILLLSVSLVIFNDPFYLLTIYKAGPTMAFFSTFFVVQFITFLIIFWVVMIRRRKKLEIFLLSMKSKEKPNKVQNLHYEGRVCYKWKRGQWNRQQLIRTMFVAKEVYLQLWHFRMQQRVASYEARE